MTLRRARCLSVVLVLAVCGVGLWPLVARSQERGPADDRGSLATEASRKAAERALALEPGNRQAREVLESLGSAGGSATPADTLRR